MQIVLVIDSYKLHNITMYNIYKVETDIVCF